MTIRFLHTADWQLGKPFAGIADVAKRARVQQERLDVITRLGQAAREHRAEFIVVAGDLFDSASVTRSTVSAACHALGRLELPVLAIPGNHDHAGPGSLWEQDFFRRESARLAPNFRLLLDPMPVEIDQAILLPCPLRRRAESADPTAWLRDPALLERLPAGKPRLVLAHGSVQGFSSVMDDEESGPGTPNLIELSRLPAETFDYVALGDWHGMKQITPHAWYSGTPEPDRFPRGADNAPGHVLLVTAQRGGVPQVAPHRTARLTWRQWSHSFADDPSLDRLQEQLASEAGGLNPETLLLLELTGSLGLEATTRLEQWLESIESLLLRLKLCNQTVVAPTPAECDELAAREGDPLIARVAAQLLSRAAGPGDEAAIARVALRELHAACTRG